MPAHRNIHRTEQDWLQILRDYENCGLTQKQFCQQNNLAFSTFTKWKVSFPPAPCTHLISWR